MELSQVILSPIISEKSQMLETIGEANGKRTKKYSFRVHPDANKPMVKAAIKKIYNITPASVDIMVYRGKVKKFRNFPAPKPHWKKAIVTFPDGETIEFTKG